MANNIEVSVVVPCYNEEKNIPLIVDRFRKALPKKISTELILVDNGSRDSTNKAIKKLSKKYKFLRIAEVVKNIGYGNGVWKGLKKARGEYTCWTHADMQTDLNDTIKAYRIIRKQRNPKKCFVKGRRKGRPLFDRFFTFGMSVFETLFLRRILYDINAQPNLFHKSFLKKAGIPPKDFSFDLYFYYMAKRMQYKIIRFPVLFKARIHGKSSWDTGIASKIKFIKRTLKFSFNLKRKLSS